MSGCPTAASFLSARSRITPRSPSFIARSGTHSSRSSSAPPETMIESNSSEAAMRRVGVGVDRPHRYAQVAVGDVPQQAAQEETLRQGVEFRLV